MEKKTEEILRLNLTHSSKVEQLKLVLKDTVSRNELFVEETEAELVELRSKIALYEAQMESKDKTEQEMKQSDVQLTEEKETIGEPEVQENGESAVRLS